MFKNLVTKGFSKWVLLMALLFAAGALFASDSHGAPETEEYGHEAAEEAEYNAGRMIIDHIVDAYEWHILDVGKTHVSVPLPVILFYEGELYTFMSSKFHHGHDPYKGFMIAKDGPKKGKIVRVGEHGKPDLEATIYDFSITKNVFAIFFSGALITFIFISVARSYKRRAGQAPRGLQSFLEPLILFVRDDIAKAAIGPKYERYTPYLLTLFFFIFFNNLMGLIPIFPFGANVTGNLAVTGIMAVFTFVITTFSGNKDYWKHIFNTPGVPWWLKIPIPLMPIVEFMGIFTKPFVLMVRLFANITAGHIIILGFMSLIFIFANLQSYMGLVVAPVSVAFGIFMGLLEILVAFIQAYVFTLLSALYFGMAIEEHHHDHTEEHAH
jgi:F-type H+-transporting ATPase subunit a